MHAPPDFRISVRRFGVWRAANGVIAVLSTAAACAWVLLSFESGLRIACAVAAVGLLGALACARPLAAVSLRWDTQLWRLGPEPTRGQEPLSGRLVVALDLGNWVLLRFSPLAAPRRAVWLPVQRGGHEADWHALRRTVHGARAMTLSPSMSAAP
jgi:hypothetical protein